MTREQFNKLKVGDVCYYKGGSDDGRRSVVLYIEGDFILLRTEDYGPYKGSFYRYYGGSYVRLAKWDGNYLYPVKD